MAGSTTKIKKKIHIITGVDFLLSRHEGRNTRGGTRGEEHEGRNTRGDEVRTVPVK